MTSLFKLFQSLLTEAYSTAHSVQRFEERVNIMKEKDISANEKANINKNIELVRKYNFPKNKSYLVLLGSFIIRKDSDYYSVNPRFNEGYYDIPNKFQKLDPGEKPSRGDSVWCIIRNNQIQTMMLRRMAQANDVKTGNESLGVDITIKNLTKFIENNPQGNQSKIS